MLSGECRIDAIPVNGEALLIDGLRLRLDLRLAPSGSRTARAERALWPRTLQKLAALAGLGALFAALVFWRWSGPAEPLAPLPVSSAPVLPAPEAIPLPLPPSLAPPPLPAPTTAATATTEAPTPGAPSVHPIREPAAARAERPVVAPIVPAAPVAPPSAVHDSKPHASLAPAPAPGVPAAAVSTERALIDLFSDPK